MDSNTFPTSPALTTDAACEACEHLDALPLGDRWLWPDRISIAGACNPVFTSTAFATLINQNPLAVRRERHDQNARALVVKGANFSGR